MVCSFGSGKMAALSRLLEAGNSLHQISEEVSHQRLIAQYISRELGEADEENLLDEEDMYVFDLKPMVDTLHLVCCNTCKKPIKASQFATHADLCKLLSLKKESFVEIDGTERQKPPKKERKKSLRSPAIVNTTNGTLHRLETAEMGTTTSESQLDDQFRMTSSFPIGAKRDSTSVDMAPKLSNLGNVGYKVRSSGVVPAAKRPKLITPDQLPLSDDPETVLSTRNSGSHDAGKELQDRMLAANNMPYSFEHQMSRQVNGCCLLSKDAPAPLASKIYYSQRNLRLRSAVRTMYSESLTDINMFSTNGLQEHVKSPHITSSTCLSDEDVNVQPVMKLPNQLASGKMPDQNIARSSEACLNKGEEFLPAGFSSQVLHTNHSRSRAASVGISGNQYLSQPHSFASNSVTIQKPNGSVPVT